MANADERLLKRRLNELDDQIKKIRRELEKIRSQHRGSSGRGKKGSERLEERERELSDMLVEFDAEHEVEEAKVQKKKGKPENKHACLKEGCRSGNTQKVSAGAFMIIVCEDCGSRHRVAVDGEGE